MNTASAPSALQRLRDKTDRQLAVLLRHELKRGLALASQERHGDAMRSYETAETLLAMAELPATDRVRLQEELDQLRDALPARAMSAA